MANITYEDKSDVIDTQLKKALYKWKLTALAWLDYDDVSQIIRLHIYTKWYQWDQKRPIEPWVNKIIANQIFNIQRNNYTNFAKPCVTCKYNQSYSEADHHLCGFTKSGLQGSECADYAKWEKGKKNAYDIKVPVSLNTFSYQKDNSSSYACLLSAEKRLHQLMKKHLTDKHFFIYKMLFVDYIDEEEVARILNYKTNETGRKAGYKQIKNLKNLYKKIAKGLVDKYDILI